MKKKVFKKKTKILQIHRFVSLHRNHQKLEGFNQQKHVAQQKTRRVSNTASMRERTKVSITMIGMIVKNCTIISWP